MTAAPAEVPPAARVNPPNGTGGAPVSTRASPVLTCEPVTGCRAVDLSTGFSVFGGVLGNGLVVGSGATISGGFDTGGATGAALVAGATSCTVLVEIGVRPPVSGPPPLLRVIVIGMTSLDFDDVRQPAGMTAIATIRTACARHETSTI